MISLITQIIKLLNKLLINQSIYILKLISFFLNVRDVLFRMSSPLFTMRCVQIKLENKGFSLKAKCIMCKVSLFPFKLKG